MLLGLYQHAMKNGNAHTTSNLGMYYEKGIGGFANEA